MMNNNCTYLYALSFTASNESGLALISADTASTAISVLRRSGKYNGTPNAYHVQESRVVGVCSEHKYELILESYTNALVAYEAICKALENMESAVSISPSDAMPLVDGDGMAGTSTLYARGDHRHPSDSTKQDSIPDLDAIRSGAASGATAYQKPQNGIPKSDLVEAVQTSLGKADSALQSFTETDPTVPSWAKQSTKPSYSYSEISGTPTLATVATSGSYNDLSNQPTIPDAVEANPTVPSGTTPTALTGLKIGNSYYSAPSVVALTNNEIDTIWTNAS